LRHRLRVVVEDDVKAFCKAIKGEQVPVDDQATDGGELEAGKHSKLKQLFKAGDAELGIGSMVDAAVCKGALLQC
jgi:hypothetical protein